MKRFLVVFVGRFISNAAASVLRRTFFSLKLITEWGETATCVNSGNQELAAESRVAMHDIKILHTHKRITPHTHGHIQRNHAVSHISLVRIRNNCACCVHVGHALHDLKLFHGLPYRCHCKLGRLFGLNNL